MGRPAQPYQDRHASSRRSNRASAVPTINPSAE